MILNLNELSTELLHNLEQAVSLNNEKYEVKNCTLRFKIQDRDEAMLIDMPSRSFKVNPSNDLIEELQHLTNMMPVLG